MARRTEDEMNALNLLSLPEILAFACNEADGRARSKAERRQYLNRAELWLIAIGRAWGEEIGTLMELRDIRRRLGL
jgi:hypothetical protein